MFSESSSGAFGVVTILLLVTFFFKHLFFLKDPVPLACGGSSTARVLLRLGPESACQTGPSLELSSRLEAGGCAVRASPGRLGSLAQPQRRGTSP